MKKIRPSELKIVGSFFVLVFLFTSVIIIVKFLPKQREIHPKAAAGPSILYLHPEYVNVNGCSNRSLTGVDNSGDGSTDSVPVTFGVVPMDGNIMAQAWIYSEVLPSSYSVTNAPFTFYWRDKLVADGYWWMKMILSIYKVGPGCSVSLVAQDSYSYYSSNLEQDRSVTRNFTFTIPSGYSLLVHYDFRCQSTTCGPGTNYFYFDSTVANSRVVLPSPLPVPDPPTADIKANGSDGPVTVDYNTAATISWSSTNATSCSVSPGGWTGTSGSQSSGNLTANTTYTLSCTGPGGTQTDSVTIYVRPFADIKANGSDGPISIAYNTAATISWTSNYATSCSVSPGGWTGTSNTGVSTGNLTANTTYTLNCTGPGGSKSDSVTVNVSALPPTVDIKANGSDGPLTLNYGASVTLSWSSTNATSCTASGSWSGSKAASGSETVGLLSGPATYTYTLECTGAGGSASDSVTVNVSRKPGDVDSDGDVDIFDLSMLLSNYDSTAYPAADFNGNGVVDIFDLSILLSHYEG